MLVLTRQNLPVLEGTKELAEDGVNKGAYILSEAKGDLDGILIATGSEVKLALDTQAALEAKGVHVRVVSMPAQNIFDEQDAAYKESILPANVTKRLAIEAGSSFGWGKYVGLKVKLLQSILGELLHQVLKSLKNMDSQLITLLAFSNLYNQL